MKIILLFVWCFLLWVSIGIIISLLIETTKSPDLNWIGSLISGLGFASMFPYFAMRR
jgi:hypothetical protein